MRPSSSAWTKGAGAPLALALLVLAHAAVAQEWYVSDASGIALEATTSSRALRLDYGLSVAVGGAEDAPAQVRAAVPVGGAVEVRTLYEAGAELRRRWAALDADGFERYVETRRADGVYTYERYDASRRFIEEGRSAIDGSLTVIRYAYVGQRLSRAEAFSVSVEVAPGSEATASGPDATEPGSGAAAAAEVPIWVDTYRYLRSGALRSVERTHLAAADQKPVTESVRFDAPRGVPRSLAVRSADGSFFRTTYDASGRVREKEAFDAEGKPIGAPEVATYETAGTAGPRSVVRSEEAEGVTVETSLDDRGRAIHEIRADAAGKTLSETRTVWKENRIASIETVAGAQTRRTEYEYDAEGNRMMERNYRDGTLERTVRRSGGEETEELFSDGFPVLRAVWVEGRKISEQRLRKGEGAER